MERQHAESQCHKEQLKSLSRAQSQSQYGNCDILVLAAPIHGSVEAHAITAQIMCRILLIFRWAANFNCCRIFSLGINLTTCIHGWFRRVSIFGWKVVIASDNPVFMICGNKIRGPSWLCCCWRRYCCLGLLLVLFQTSPLSSSLLRLLWVFQNFTLILFQKDTRGSCMKG